MKINEHFIVWLIFPFLFPFPLSELHTSDTSVRLLNICEVRSINFSELTVQCMVCFSVNK